MLLLLLFTDSKRQSFAHSAGKTARRRLWRRFVQRGGLVAAIGESQFASVIGDTSAALLHIVDTKRVRAPRVPPTLLAAWREPASSL